MTIELIVSFIIFAVVASITPGPNNLMLLTSGINFGFHRTLPHLLGVCIGFSFMICVIGFGLVKLFDLYPVIYDALKILSVIYLVYLSWKIATSKPLKEIHGNGQIRGSRPMTFLQAVFFQWVNSKAWVIAMAAISAYSPPIQPILSILFVALFFGLINLPSGMVWLVSGTILKRFFGDPFKLRIFNITAACLLVGSLYPILFQG